MDSEDDGALERCLPACARRSEAVGMEVRRLRRVLRFSIEMLTGTVMGIAGEPYVSLRGSKLDRKEKDILSPLMFLTKICIVSHGSGEEETERVEETIIAGVLMLREGPGVKFESIS